jgi:acyl carrier protein
MIPSYFVPLEKIPLTPNKKIDWTALPGPKTGIENEDPVLLDKTEEKLAGIWSDVLKVNKKAISSDSNFFELGGHSLKATILTTRIYKELDVKVPLAVIFKSQTLGALSQYIKGSRQDKYQEIKVAEKREYYELSSAQKRLYVLRQMEPQSTAYNMPRIMRVEGDLRKEKVKDTLTKLVLRHESFRTSFQMINQESFQKIHEPIEIDVTLMYCTLPEAETQPIVKGFFKPFDLGQPPLFRVGLIETAPGQYILMIDTHHIITDGTSNQIFLNEFTRLYNGEEPAPLRVQYKDFSQWKNSYKEVQALKKSEAYWKKQFADTPPQVNLPCDFTRPSERTFAGHTLMFEIGAEETKIIKQWLRQDDVTLFMLLLTVYNVLLWKITGLEDIVVGTGVMGRGHPDLKPIIGMFVNMLALRNHPSSEKPFSDFLQEVKECTLSSFENRDYPFEELVEQVMETRHAGRNPLVEVVFSVQNLDFSVTPLSELTFKSFGYKRQIAKYDLTIIAADTGNHLFFRVEYSTELFKEKTIERFIGYFKEIVSTVTANKTIKLKDIKISYELEDSEADILQFDFGFPG